MKLAYTDWSREIGPEIETQKRRETEIIKTQRQRESRHRDTEGRRETEINKTYHSMQYYQIAILSPSMNQY